MNNLSDIKRRLESVRQTRQITGAMETISVSKMRKAVEKYEGFRVYSNSIARAMRLANASYGKTADSFDKIYGKKLYIIIASDKGLCGSFNHDVFRFADNVIGDESIVMPIGQTAAEYYSDHDNTDLRFVGSALDYALSNRLGMEISDGYGTRYCSVSIISTELINHGSWHVAEHCVFPIDDPSGDDAEVVDFEPSAESALKTLTPLYISSTVYGAILGSCAAEHSARRAAMSASTKNADEMISTLSVEYNRARQSTVTEQITEIIGSTAALDISGDKL